MSKLNWESVKLSDCCISISDGDHQPPPKANHGIPFVTISNINSYNKLNFDNAMSVPKDYYDRLDATRRAQKGDILYSVVGSFGIPVLIEDNKPFVFQRHIAILRPCNKVSSEFLYYTMLSKDFYAKANAVAIGAAQRTVTLSALRNIEIPLPPLPIQRKIAAVLTALDDKIALNRRINDKLEAMAKRLYDYWFVQFDFPDENGRPYKSSGGKMVWNETLKREIPAGWEVQPLKQFASYRTDTTKSENAYNYISTDNMLPNKQGISDETIYPSSGNIFQYKQNDILISNIRPYFKKIWFASHCGTCSTDILCIYSNQQQHNCYIYRTLWRDDFFDYVMQGAKGSKMPRGDKEHIMNYPICCHNYLTNVLLKAFNDKCMAVQEMLYRNNTETVCLTALRDRLLPLLMNGQVGVEGEV